MSETSVVRPWVEHFCKGTGLDLGCGDDLIVPWAIGIDRNQKGKTSILGNIAKLDAWFKSGVMDFVFSSHALEDEYDTEAVLSNWLDVLKIGGMLVLFLPDQQLYEAHCKRNKTLPNQDHKHKHFNMEYVKQCLKNIGYGPECVVFEKEPVGVYSFILVVKKPS